MSDPPLMPPGTWLPPLVRADEPERLSTPTESRKGRKSSRRGSSDGAGRFAVVNHFVDNRMGTLPRGAALVWLTLWRDTQPNGLARSSIAWLAERIGCNRSTVVRAIRLLAKQGLVEIARRGGVNRGASTYRVRSGP
jgi:hypothetical protein